MNGRNSITIGFRVTDQEYGYLKEAAEKKGITVAALIKGKTVEFVEKLKSHSASTTTPTSETPKKEGNNAISHSASAMEEPPIFDPVNSMPGDTVTFVDRRGNKRVGIV